MSLLVHVIEDSVVEVATGSFGISDELAELYPTGQLYLRNTEYGKPQWRVLVRGKKVSEYVSHYPTVMPIEVHQLPECVQVVHLCAE